MCRCLKLIAAFCFISAGGLHSVNGIRSRRTSIEDQTVESVRVDMKDERVLRLFNLTADELKKRTESLAAAKAGSTAAPKDNQRFVNVKGYRFEDIRSRIQMAIDGRGTTSNENSDNIQHEMAAYPICNSETNESSWQDDLNVTIRFSESLFEAKSNALYLESALLRLYKLNPNSTLQPTSSSKGCAEPNIESQIRVTVSIILKKNRRNNNPEKRKRICNTLMMNVSQTGWVEIDIKRAIHIWETVERHRPSSVAVGSLLIEVHDEEDRPRNAGLYFRPPKCEQAGHAIPWNFYRSYSTMHSSFADEVPRYPRIDIKLIGADNTLLPHNPNARANANLNRELYRISNHSSEESITTPITPSDNLLVPSDSTDNHKHRQRHARHHHHHSHNSAPIVEGNIAGATAATGNTRSDISSEENSGHASDC